MKEEMKWRRTAIVTLIISAIIVTAGVPLVSALFSPVTVQGTVRYANGSYVPDGWTVTLWNLDEDPPDEPWTASTGTYPPCWNYTVVGKASGEKNFYINVSDPTGTYKGEATFTGAPLQPPYIINLTVTSGPSVAVLYPNGGEEIPMGTAIKASAHAEDDTGVVAVLFNYSCDNGSTWIPIGAGNKVSGTFTDGVWNVSWTPEIPGNCTWSECLVRADVVNNEAETATDTSDGTFSLVDRTKPIVINPSATPARIIKDSGFTELQIDVADTYNSIDTVTVNLSAIGGNPATNMSNIGNYSASGLTWTIYNYTTNSSVEGTFCLQVNATDICGNSNTSVCIPLEIIAGVPPTNLTAEWNQTDNTVKVSWEGTPEASYDIYLATNKSGPFNKVDTVTGLSWIDTNATDTTLRLYRVNLSGMAPNPNMTAGKFNITIYNGWNLISLPLLPSNTSIDAVVCSDKAVDDDYIYAAIPGTGMGSWKMARYYAGAWHDFGTGLTTFEPGMGYQYNRTGGNFTWTYTDI